MPKQINYTEDTNSIPNGVRRFLDSNVGYSTDIFHDVIYSYSNSDLASLISSSNDKKSSAYKAAIRRVQIWKQKGVEPSKPRKGTLDYRGKILDIAKRANLITDSDRLKTVNSIGGNYKITVKGTKKISNDITDRDFWLSMNESYFRDFLRIAIENGQDSAIDYYTNPDVSSDGRHYPSFMLFQGSDTNLQIERL